MFLIFVAIALIMISLGFSIAALCEASEANARITSRVMDGVISQYTAPPPNYIPQTVRDYIDRKFAMIDAQKTLQHTLRYEIEQAQRDIRYLGEHGQALLDYLKLKVSMAPAQARKIIVVPKPKQKLAF